MKFDPLTFNTFNKSMDPYKFNIVYKILKFSPKISISILPCIKMYIMPNKIEGHAADSAGGIHIASAAMLSHVTCINLMHAMMVTWVSLKLGTGFHGRIDTL